MARIKKRKALVTKEERQLIYNSEFINNYPKIKELLRKNLILYKNDIKFLKNTDIDTYNKILYAFEEIKDGAYTEWFKYKYNGYYETNCSLCGRKNTYIYLIKNNKNGQVMNVGSECIDKFPNIKGKINGKDIRDHKKSEIKKQMKINRVVEFNTEYPDIEKTFEKWKIEYENLELVMPKDIDERMKRLYFDGKNFYEDYINGKMTKSQLNGFNKYLKEYDLIKRKSINFIEENKNNKFVCNKLIKNWLINNNLKGIINAIIFNNGFINENIAKSIYCYEFIEKFLDEIEMQFNKFNIKLHKCDSNKITFEYQYKHHHTIVFENTLKDFMSKFSFILFETSIHDLDYVVKNLNLKWEETELDKFIDIINTTLNKHRYRITLNFNRNEIEIENKNKKQYVIVNADIFISNRKNILFLSEDESSTNLLETISKIQKWSDIKEKEKYNLDDIERIMKNKRTS